ncbi:acetyl esterase [[Enterobacter] lignolyticus]|uniref:Acetyl esterase n=1 Tax=Enterobacter lignolyticus (strain SCF1) TaxID=701347 RepID=E3G9M9_ENTLS|nr:acetyl esterase [[Enterobacter] lignolyticus]ADO48732.1 acetyl esterase [[Enterobacter] lignolyticus SCF1]
MKPDNKIPVLDRISGQMREVLEFQASLPQAVCAADDYAAMRQAYNDERRYWNEGGPQMLRTEEVAVPTAWGHVLTRIYAPQAQPGATLFYVHGGGFILGNLDTHDRIMRLLAHFSGCTVVGIDYSLSPQARFPQAIEEIVAVCQFYRRHGERYGLNSERIGLAGDSAGAMLALAAALWIRDRKIDCGTVCGLLLWYGLYGLQDSVSRRLYGGSWDGLTQRDLASYDAAYLRHADDRDSPYYCLFNNDLTRDVPPCFIAGAEFDPLLDDSLALSQTLLAHGQPCQYTLYPGVLHAFLHYSRRMNIAGTALRDGAHYFLQQINR